MPNDPNPTHVSDAKAAFKDIKDHETAATVVQHALNTAKANGVSREEVLDVVGKVFPEPPAAPVAEEKPPAKAAPTTTAPKK